MQNPCLMHKDGQIFCSGTRNAGLVMGLLMPEPAHRRNAPKRKKDQQIRKSIGLLCFLLIRFF
jgi:hypothetical protein